MNTTLSLTLLALTFALPACGDDSNDDGADTTSSTTANETGDAGDGDGATSDSGGDGDGAGDGDASSGGDGDSSGGDGDGDACAGVTPEVINISPTQLNDMLMNKDFEFINVHIPNAGEIPGTDIHIPFDDVPAIESHLGNDAGKKAVLYCLTGPMSAMAASALVAKGYCQIYDMPAGMVGWEAEGYPVDP